MAKTTTTYLGLSKFDLEDNPGNVPLNDNWDAISLAVGTEHNTAGTHKAAVIDCTSLKSTVYDDSTLEQDSSTKKGKIKDAGITAAKLGTDSVTAVKLNADCAGAGLGQDGNGALYSKVDDVTIELNGSSQHVIKALPTGLAKCKQSFIFDFDTSVMYAGRVNIDTYTHSGYCLPRAGYITAITACGRDGSVDSVLIAYGTSGYAFIAEDVLQCIWNAQEGDPVEFHALIDGLTMSAAQADLANGTTIATILIEVEYT